MNGTKESNLTEGGLARINRIIRITRIIIQLHNLHNPHDHVKKMMLFKLRELTLFSFFHPHKPDFTLGYQ